ncbi:Putative tyrosinase-like protein tyr-3 [Zootermopsis nevadensis]|uniref:Putative tyrosinase-like protein tyr-3 n=2 Tax=Zootermopsis nevadensis TaxID=136037 RepID=A0A067RJE3_ZOONE|nr:Putative tyrosinase-like protein tyr-3 [Zootermopsis nevadensis]
MNVNCAKSCRLCDSKCGNYNRNCEEWARLRECTKNPDYMTIYCPKACHSCHGGTGADVGCKDWNEYCAAWARNGQCRVNPDYMLVYCRKSCSQC